MEFAGPILQYAGEHGPYLVIIGFLLRSLALKDRIIETLTQQALAMAHQTRGAAQAASAAVRVATKAIEDQ